ncbi:MAG: hypothetical protein H0U27_12060 [Nitrosopumilus sp.]|nr:hypothetical protein [Nitrosopumilus sp.]
MYNKILFSLKKITISIIVFLIYNVAFSQHYIGFTKQDLIMIKGDDYTIKKGVIMYDRPSEVVFGKETEGGLDLFYFDNNDKVRLIVRFGLFSEEDVMKIVSYNNQNYKKVNVGKKQGFFQWLDIQNKISFKLEVTSGLDKFHTGDYSIEKEQ